VLTTGSLVITRSGSRYTVVASGTGVLRDEDGETEEILELQYIGKLQQQETYQ
jgi:hypothetical protein